jgi:hypothetical protein
MGLLNRQDICQPEIILKPQIRQIADRRLLACNYLRSSETNKLYDCWLRVLDLALGLIKCPIWDAWGA